MRVGTMLAGLVLGLFVLAGASAAPPPERLAVLRRGINLTNWFRFPADRSASALRAYLGDPAIADLRRAGFNFVRLAVDPA